MPRNLHKTGRRSEKSCSSKTPFWGAALSWDSLTLLEGHACPSHAKSHALWQCESIGSPAAYATSSAATLPSGKFGTNAAWFRLNMQTYNLISALKRPALPGDSSEARPKRLQFLVFNTVGKVIHPARRSLVRLTSATQQALLAFGRSKIQALSPT